MTGFELEEMALMKAAKEGILTNEEVEKRCKVLAFMEICDDEDFCNMFDMGAFNEIMMGYVRKAVSNLDCLDDEQKVAVRNEVSMLLDEVRACEIIK